MLDQLTAGNSRIQAEVEQSVKTLTGQLQASHDEMKRLLSQSLEDAHKRVLSHLEDASRQIKTQVLALDKALDEELTKALETLGRQLASLSEKFVADYSPLTERLQRLLEVARVS